FRKEVAGEVAVLVAAAMLVAGDADLGRMMVVERPADQAERGVGEERPLRAMLGDQTVGLARVDHPCPERQWPHALTESTGSYGARRGVVAVEVELPAPLLVEVPPYFGI